jgi:hypothetical protein
VDPCPGAAGRVPCGLRAPLHQTQHHAPPPPPRTHVGVAAPAGGLRRASRRLNSVRTPCGWLGPARGEFLAPNSTGASPSSVESQPPMVTQHATCYALREQHRAYAAYEGRHHNSALSARRFSAYPALWAMGCGWLPGPSGSRDCHCHFSKRDWRGWGGSQLCDLRY